MASCWESFTSALSPASTTPQQEAALREQLLARDQRLRERAVALRRKHDEVVCETAADEAATLDAMTREREADADRRVVVMTKERYEEQLRVLITDLKAKDERMRVLEAILDTVQCNKNAAGRQNR
jgi:hypothetical protein